MKSKTDRQPNEILKKEYLAPSITRFEIYYSPDRPDGPARPIRRRPGRRLRRTDPLDGRSTAIWNSESITLIVQVVGVSTRKMDKLNVGEAFLDVVGPLGKPTEIKKAGTVVCIGGGVGVAPVYPITKAFKNGRQPDPFHHRRQDQGDDDLREGDARRQRRAIYHHRRWNGRPPRVRDRRTPATDR